MGQDQMSLECLFNEVFESVEPSLQISQRTNWICLHLFDVKKKSQFKLSPTCGLLLLNVLYCIFLNYWYSLVPLSYVAKKCIKPLLPTLAWSVLGGLSCRCCSASVASLNIKSSRWPLEANLFNPLLCKRTSPTLTNLSSVYSDSIWPLHLQ